MGRGGGGGRLLRGICRAAPRPAARCSIIVTRPDGDRAPEAHGDGLHGMLRKRRGKGIYVEHVTWRDDKPYTCSRSFRIICNL